MNNTELIIMQFESSRCILLNATYEVHDIVPLKKALYLVLEDKAVVVESHPTFRIRSKSTSIEWPVIIALKKYVKSTKVHRRAALNPTNLFIRDDHTCQYCGRHEHEFRGSEKLTRDHVYPEHRGGETTWENLVAACSTCNGKKANYLLEHTGMMLRKIPRAPTIIELWKKHPTRGPLLKKVDDLFGR